MSIKRHVGNLKGTGGQKMPFSKAVEAGGFLYVSGQVPMDANGEIIGNNLEQQMHKVMENIQAILDEAGYSLKHTIKVNAWLDDARDFNAFNKIFAQYFSDNPPARSTVVSKLVIDAKIEIDLIAYQPNT